MKSIEAFESRNPSVTVAFQSSLLSRGVAGQLAFGVFRAQKRSTVAKGQRRGKYRRGCYDGKNEALKYVDSLMQIHARNLGLTWGWGIDRSQEYHSSVLYVDLPTGQCSFHSESSVSTTVYRGNWDRKSNSRDAILAYCDEVLLLPVVNLGPSDLMPFGSRVGDRISSLDASYVNWLLNWEGISKWPEVFQSLHSLSS